MPRWQTVLGGDDSAPIEEPERRRSLATEVPALAGAALLIAFIVKTFLAQAFFIPSGSMIPALEVGDRVVVSRTAYQLHDPRRGDIVVFESAGNGDGNGSALPIRIVRNFFETVGLAQPSAEDFIKRVIGLPGETVAGRNGQVVVDGRALQEPYLQAVVIRDFEAVEVPEGHVFVMGDNRDSSSDSREFGPIPESRIVGRAVMRVWPPGRVGFL